MPRPIVKLNILQPIQFETIMFNLFLSLFNIDLFDRNFDSSFLHILTDLIVSSILIKAAMNKNPMIVSLIAYVSQIIKVIQIKIYEQSAMTKPLEIRVSNSKKFCVSQIA